MSATLVFLHDAYGGYGGMAKFNRDLLEALAAIPGAGPVAVLPRNRPVFAETPPPEIDCEQRAASGIGGYLAAFWRRVTFRPRCDIVVCGHIRLIAFAVLYRLLRGGKVLLVIHGTEAWERPAGILTRWLAPKADRFVAVSGVTRDRFVSWAGVAPDRIAIVPNTIDLDRFRPGPPDAQLIERYALRERRVIMTMSRLHPGDSYKGTDELIELMPMLRQEHPDLAYLVVGEGDDRPRLEEKARTLGVAEYVVFTGYIEEAEKADHLRLADLFLLAGTGEGFGIVLLEAMACGIPVVASTRDGSREAVRDGALGIMVDPADREALAAAIRDGLARPKGAAPDGLDYFSRDRFRDRIGAVVAALRSDADRAPSEQPR